MNAPILWMISPAVISLLLLTIQSRRIRNYTFIIVCLILVGISLFTRIDLIGTKRFYTFDISSTLTILGRSFAIFEEGKFLIQFIYGFNAIWGTSLIIFKKSERIIPLGLLFSALLIAAISVEPFLYSAFFIEIAIIMSIPLMMESGSKEISGVTRYLIFLTLSMPFILLAGWFLAGGEIIPVNPEQLVQATLLLGLGFILWLAVFPFHSWVPMIFSETDPLRSGFILLLLESAFFILILKFINGFVWLREYDVFFQASLFLGAIMSVFGSIGLVFQEKLKRLAGFELLHTIGVILLSIGLSPAGGISLFPNIFGSRILGFSLLCWSISALENSDNGIFPEDIKQVNMLSLISAACMIYSLLVLSGMPLTIGFPPMQVLYQLLAGKFSLVLILLLLSNSFLAIVAFRIIARVVKNEFEFNKLLIIGKKEIFLLTYLFLLIVIGIFPNLLLPKFQNLILGFDFLIK